MVTPEPKVVPKPEPKVKPARLAAHHTSASCAMPAIGTDRASVLPICRPRALSMPRPNASDPSRPRAAPTSTAMIKMMFSTTGAAAAAIKRPVAFNTPDTSAASEMKRI